MLKLRLLKGIALTLIHLLQAKYGPFDYPLNHHYLGTEPGAAVVSPSRRVQVAAPNVATRGLHELVVLVLGVAGGRASLGVDLGVRLAALAVALVAGEGGLGGGLVVGNLGVCESAAARNGQEGSGGGEDVRGRGETYPWETCPWAAAADRRAL